jgi:hypothetical protein
MCVGDGAGRPGPGLERQVVRHIAEREDRLAPDPAPRRELGDRGGLADADGGVGPGEDGTAFGLELAIFDGTTLGVFSYRLAEELGVPEAGSLVTRFSRQAALPSP